MVDRVYKADLPRSRKKLLALREEFSRLGPAGTGWAELRVDPLIAHVSALEHLIESERFSDESSRLRKGVVLFHSDLVYLRQNIVGLRKLLESESKRLKRRKAAT